MRTAVWELRAADILVGFKDGISEARNEGQQNWGEEWLLAALRPLARKAPAAIIERFSPLSTRLPDERRTWTIWRGSS